MQGRQSAIPRHRASGPDALPYLALLLAAWSCTTEPTVAVGALRVSVSTTGDDADLDGYTVQVDGAHTRPINLFGATTFSDLAAGSHLVELSGLSENCVASSGTRFSVTVTADSTARVAFAVDCAGTGLEVSVPTSGLDAPPFTVMVDGVTKGNVYPNFSLRVTRLSAGGHEVALAGVPANCRVNGSNPRAVDVPTSQVIPISFAMSCVAATGSIEVTTSTTGIDQDRNGYTAWITAAPTRAVSLNGIVTIEKVPPGDHVVHLGSLAPNCAAVDGDQRPVRVTAGGMTRDTARVRFEVSCSRVWHLAFNREGSIALATADGSVIEIVDDGGWSPAWSPDGVRLAYNCGGICITSFDGRAPVRLGIYDVFDPAWRPDGRRIAGVSWLCDYDDNCSLEGLVLLDPDGSNRLQLAIPSTVTWALAPAWSPDGNQLAFTCWLASSQNGEICVMNVDGTGFRQLTSDSTSDGAPAWKPDGSAIAFHTTRYGAGPEIVVTDLDGASITRLSPGEWGGEPSWSPDGSRIVFSGGNGLFVMNADGSGRTRLTGFPWDHSPVWRP